MPIEHIPPDANIFGIRLIHIIGGAAGGLARTLTRPNESIWRRITTTIVGAVVAGYGAPAGTKVVLHYFGALGLNEADVTGTVGFVLGVVGMSLLEGAIEWVNRWRKNPRLPPR